MASNPKRRDSFPRECDGLPRALFFGSGHVPPLLRNFEKLFLDKGIARPFGEFFALLCLGAVLFRLGRHGRSSALAEMQLAGGMVSNHRLVLFTHALCRLSYPAEVVHASI